MKNYVSTENKRRFCHKKNWIKFSRSFSCQLSCGIVHIIGANLSVHYRTTDRDVAKGKTRNYVFKGSLETLVISFYWWYPPQHNELWWNNEVAVAPVKLSRQLCQLKTSHEHNRLGNNSRLQWSQKLWQVTSSSLLTPCNSAFQALKKKKKKIVHLGLWLRDIAKKKNTFCENPVRCLKWLQVQQPAKLQKP